MDGSESLSQVGDDEDLDYFEESLAGNAKVQKAKPTDQLNQMSICEEDCAELGSMYSELDQSMAQKKSQLVAVANAKCSVCLRQ